MEAPGPVRSSWALLPPAPGLFSSLGLCSWPPLQGSSPGAGVSVGREEEGPGRVALGGSGTARRATLGPAVGPHGLAAKSDPRAGRVGRCAAQVTPAQEEALLGDPRGGGGEEQPRHLPRAGSAGLPWQPRS